MRKLRVCLSLFLPLFCWSNLSAQITGDTTTYDQIFTKVEVTPEFPGGVKAWLRYLERNLDANLADRNGAPSGSYKVIIQFIVDKEGKVSDVKPLTSHGYGMEEEFMRIIKKGPSWVPAQQAGRNVKSYFSLPITFIVP